MTTEDRKPIKTVEGDPIGDFSEESLREVAGSTDSVFESISPCASLFIGQICADIDLQSLRATVWLRIGGFEVARIQLSVGQTQTLRGRVDDLAKADLNIRFERNGIKVDGNGCTKPFFGGWRCRSINFWLIQW